MSSLRKYPQSKMWYGCFTRADGQRVQRSTGTADKELAKQVLAGWVKTNAEGKSGRLNHNRVRETMAEIFRIATHDELPSATIKGFLASWLADRQLATSDATYERYKAAVDSFLEYLGDKASGDMNSLSTSMMLQFRDSLAKKLSPATVNLTIKILRSAVQSAMRQKIVSSNEVASIARIHDASTDDARRPFTIEEIQKILAVASAEWQGIIMTGFYTGLRMGDIVRLTWANVDVARAEISLNTRKTQRRVVIPMATPLVNYFANLPGTDDPAVSVFPKANETLNAAGDKVATLSNQFYALMFNAGLVPKRSHKATKGGRSVQRDACQLSFHCLRHTATSLLKNAGVSSVVAMDIIGHESEAISRHYTHIDSDTKREAIKKLPSLIIKTLPQKV